MREFKKNVLGWLFSIFIALAIVFFIKTFLIMPTTVVGTSMFPTLMPKDKLIISTWSKNFNKVPERGSIITFESPSIEKIENYDNNYPVAVYKNNKNFIESLLYNLLGLTQKSYIKRVIGLPGEHIQIKNGGVYVNGEKLEEKYLFSGMITDMSSGGEFCDVWVPDDCVFVLGDNRSASSDSRSFGCIPVRKIEGKVVCRWWPIGRIKSIK